MLKDTEKMLDKMQHLSEIKIFYQLSIEETSLQIINTVYDKLKANIILNRKK